MKSSRILNIVLLLVALVAFVFAYLQKVEANHQRVIAEQLKMELEDARKISELAREEAMRQRSLAEENQKRAQEALYDAQTKLQELKSSKAK